ncbi:MAG: glycosyltransferase [Desulfobacterales bacterium]|nr:glycosyltransferase [Desulfobacterales bacterium]MBF0396882.1 glycosyltransferase [Desulfobacterales bacterium]
MNYIRKRPKILLIADRPDWAYDHICHFIIDELSKDYDFYIDYLAYHYKGKAINIRQWLGNKRNYFKSCLKRKILKEGNISYDLICFLGWYFPFTADFNIKAKGSIQGIFTEGFPPKGYTISGDIDIETFVKKYLNKSLAIIAGSKGIYDTYSPHIKNLYYATGAIDTNLFQFYKKNKTIKKSLVVGWTGDPNRSFKGFYDYVIPAVKKASLLRPEIYLKTRFRGSFKTLPMFYKDIDIMLIASSADAGPSSFIEAGSCGIPSISTKIGIPSETIEHGRNGLIVERSIEVMSQALVYLYDNRDILYNMSIQIRNDIVNRWGYKSRIYLWRNLFHDVLKKI